MSSHSSVLVDIQNKIGDVEEFFRLHDAPVREGETVIGVATYEMKAIYTLHMATQRLFRELGIQIEYSQDPETKVSLRTKQIGAETESEMYRRLFWFAIQVAHPESIPHSVGIRERWQIVVFDPPSDINEAMQMLFGGGAVIGIAHNPDPSEADVAQ